MMTGHDQMRQDLAAMRLMPKGHAIHQHLCLGCFAFVVASALTQEHTGLSDDMLTDLLTLQDMWMVTGHD